MTKYSQTESLVPRHLYSMKVHSTAVFLQLDLLQVTYRLCYFFHPMTSFTHRCISFPSGDHIPATAIGIGEWV
jgi:hypothetical protein